MNKAVVLSTAFVLLLSLTVFWNKNEKMIDDKIKRIKNLVKSSIKENYGNKCSSGCKKMKNCRESFDIIKKNLSGLSGVKQFSVFEIIKNIKSGESHNIRIYWSNTLSKTGMENKTIDVINSLLWGDYLKEIDYLYSADTQKFCIESSRKIMQSYDLNTRENNAHILLTFTKNNYFPTKIETKAFLVWLQ